MKDNIKPDHYRTGEIDLYEAWYRTYPFNEYRAIMQAVAERYMRRDKNDRVEDLDKAMETLKRLKEKEIEHLKEKENEQIEDKLARNYKVDENIYLLKAFLEHGFNYLARNFYGDVWIYQFPPIKRKTSWYNNTLGSSVSEKIDDRSFPEVKWTDDEPTKISELLEYYEKCGESGKVEVE